MAMEYKDYIEDLSRFLLKREEQSKIMSAVASLLQGDIKAEDIPYIKEFECIKKFLEEPLNSRGESALKKVFATVVIIANLPPYSSDGTISPSTAAASITPAAKESTISLNL